MYQKMSCFKFIWQIFPNLNAHNLMLKRTVNIVKLFIYFIVYSYHVTLTRNEVASITAGFVITRYNLMLQCVFIFFNGPFNQTDSIRHGFVWSFNSAGLCSFKTFVIYCFIGKHIIYGEEIYWIHKVLNFLKMFIKNGNKTPLMGLCIGNTRNIKTCPISSKKLVL